METQLAEEISGEIELDHLPDSKQIRSFIKKRIRSQIGRFNPKTHFSIRLQREGHRHLVSCHLEIKIGSHTWISSQYAPGMHQAMDTTLAQVKHQMSSVA